VLRFPAAARTMGAQDHARFTRELSADELASCFSSATMTARIASRHGDTSPSGSPYSWNRALPRPLPARDRLVVNRSLGDSD